MLLWILILAISLWGCTFMIKAILSKYYQSPIVISYSNNDEDIGTIPFPAVTICSADRFNQTKYNFTHYMYKVYHEINLTSSEEKLFTYAQILCTSFDVGADPEEFYSFLSDARPDPFQSSECEFMGVSYSCKEIFTPIVTKYGICYSFNVLNFTEFYTKNTYIPLKFSSGAFTGFNPSLGYLEDDVYPKRALKAGIENSLYVKISQNKSDNSYLCNVADKLNLRQGFHVILHNSWEGSGMNHHRLSLNSELKLALEPEVIKISSEVAKYEPETRKCYLNQERPLHFFKYYTQWNCMTECRAKYLLDKCGCASFYLPKNNTTPLCADFQCMRYKGIIAFSKLVDYSFCDCKPGCESIKYLFEKSTSSRDFPGEELEFSTLRVYFKDDFFTPLERTELYDVTDLISSFGGLLGLFTGFSFMSLAEIFYYLTLRIYFNWRLYGQWAGR